jgi:hypothetical protein
MLNQKPHISPKNLVLDVLPSKIKMKSKSFGVLKMKPSYLVLFPQINNEREFYTSLGTSEKVAKTPLFLYSVP